MKEKKIFIWFIIITIVLLYFTINEKIEENIELHLNKNYYIENIFTPAMFSLDMETILVGNNSWNINEYRDESKIKIISSNYYGTLEKITKVNNTWVGKLMDYNKIEKVGKYSKLIYSDLDEKSKKKYEEYIRNHSGYFIIGKDVEKFNLTLEEVNKYFKTNFIYLENPNKYFQKYGSKKRLTLKYQDKNIEYFDVSSPEYNKMVKNFYKQKREKILIIFIILIIEILFYIKNFKSILNLCKLKK